MNAPSPIDHLEAWTHRGTGSPVLSSPTAGALTADEFVYGDGQDWVAADEPLGQGVRVRRDASGAVEVVNSLTGFPPLHAYLRDGLAIVASSLEAVLSRAAELGEALVTDPVGLAEWARIGQPIMHRTLVAGVQVVPAGSRLRLDGHGSWSWGLPWTSASAPPFASMAEYMAAQEEALLAATQRLDGRMFLSLTAGLDTRAVLALLVRADLTMPCVTISGVADSLDVIGARALCRALGLRHDVVRPDAAFFGDLEALTRDAVRRSGGLAGLEQAMEVYLYRQTDPGAARLSGNLGNQVGRSGTEGVGQRGLSASLFREPLRRVMNALPARHWHQRILEDGVAPALALIQRESLFASLGNAAIGSTLATQRSPYADRRVIEQKLREPRTADPAASTRWRDLRHRFLGPDARDSFQRAIIVRTGGPVAHIPVNWGAVPAGGLSPRYVMLGLGSALDAVLSKETRTMRRFRWARPALRVQGLSGFRAEPFWAHPHGHALVMDTMSDAVRTEHPWFDVAAIRALIASAEPTDLRVLAQLLTIELGRHARAQVAPDLAEPATGRMG